VKQRLLIFSERRHTLALSKERKQEVFAQYKTWFSEASAIVLTEYTGLDMPGFDALRASIRETGGEFHVVKNTLARRAFEEVGLELPAEYFTGSTAVGIAFDDPPGMAKAILDLAKDKEFVVVKGGLMDGNHLTPAQVKVVADLPPLPVVRGQLLGTIMAPASKLVRTVNEPGRSLAQVIKAYADK
jgi:large subunit ribosomal protein L10